jgi:hypothetical protein
VAVNCPVTLPPAVGYTEETDTQLYLAIGVPIVFNGAMLTLMVTLLRDLWRMEMRRVEGVLDARLKHVEERLEHLENR